MGTVQERRAESLVTSETLNSSRVGWAGGAVGDGAEKATRNKPKRELLLDERITKRTRNDRRKEQQQYDKSTLSVGQDGVVFL